MNNLAKILSILLLTGCAATGPAYTSSVKGNVIVYRTTGLAGAASPYHVQVGNQHCSLKNGGFYPISLKKKDVLAVGWSQGAVSDTIEVAPGDYIRVSHSVGAAMIGGGGVGFGAIGGAIGAQNQGAGDFYLQKMPKSMAQAELSSLNQDCM